MSYDSAIAALSIDALKFVKDNSVVGLGSGRAATALVNSLASLIKIKKYKILGIPTSLQIKLIAEKGGIPIVEADQVEHIDVVFDGADQIDGQKFVIKGGGGALLRENILFNLAKKVVVMADKTKFVKNFKLDLVHIHVNNFGDIRKDNFPTVIEMTFSKNIYNKNRKDNFEFPNKKLDQPNDPNKKDLEVKFI